MARILAKSLVPKIGKLHIKDVFGNTEFELPNSGTGPLELHIVGRNSQQWLDIIKKIKDNSIDNEADLWSKTSKDAVEFASSLIVGWEDNGLIDVPYSKEEALNLVSNPDNIDILQQIQEFIMDSTNFFLKN